MCTFEYVWMLLKPGSDVYTVPRTFAANCPRSVFVCDGSTGGPVQKKVETYVVKLWDLQSDGNYVRRHPATAEIAPFAGEREIRSLLAYPTSFVEKDKWQPLEQRLVARGKRCYEYTSISHKHFHGYTIGNPRRAVSLRYIEEYG